MIFKNPYLFIGTKLFELEVPDWDFSLEIAPLSPWILEFGIIFKKIT